LYPKLIEVGNFYLPTYGVLVALGFLAGLAVTVKLARRMGLNAETMTNLAVYVALSGMLGAKILMVLFDFKDYAANPGRIFSFETLQAAGVYQGGLILAVRTAVFYMRRAQLPALLTSDVFAPGLALGHAIGRVGCFLAGCCWGKECTRPWAVTFTNPDARQLTGVPLGVPLHPTQLYESLAEAIIFVYLYRRFHQPHREGSIIGLYLILYSTVRFVVEFVRNHEQALPFNGPLSLTQWISLGTLAAGIWLTTYKRREPVAA